MNPLQTVKSYLTIIEEDGLSDNGVFTQLPAELAFVSRTVYTRPRVIKIRWKIWHPQGNPILHVQTQTVSETCNGGTRDCTACFPHEEHTK
jgi:hypothetical protein